MLSLHVHGVLNRVRHACCVRASNQAQGDWNAARDSGPKLGERGCTGVCRPEIPDLCCTGGIMILVCTWHGRCWRLQVDGISRQRASGRKVVLDGKQPRSLKEHLLCVAWNVLPWHRQSGA